MIKVLNFSHVRKFFIKFLQFSMFFHWNYLLFSCKKVAQTLKYSFDLSKDTKFFEIFETVFKICQNTWFSIFANFSTIHNIQTVSKLFYSLNWPEITVKIKRRNYQDKIRFYELIRHNTTVFYKSNMKISHIIPIQKELVHNITN